LRKDIRGGVFLVQLNVNKEEIQVMTKLPGRRWGRRGS